MLSLMQLKQWLHARQGFAKLLTFPHLRAGYGGGFGASSFVGEDLSGALWLGAAILLALSNGGLDLSKQLYPTTMRESCFYRLSMTG